MKDDKDSDDKNKKGKNSTGIVKFTKKEIDRSEKEVDEYIKAAQIDDVNDFMDQLVKQKALELISESDNSTFANLPIEVLKVVDGIITHFSNDLFDGIEDINAKEEDISSALSIKITDTLVGDIQSSLNGKTIGGYRFKVKTQKKQKQEAYTGADLVGVCTIDQGGIIVNKYFLIQAKIGVRKENGTSFAKDKRIQTQATKMLQISPASYFVLYTKMGFDVVSAMNVRSTGKNEIDTALTKSISFERFINLILDCFAGDNRFEKEEWRDYITDPKNNSIPYEEALLHIIVKKQKKHSKSSNK